MWEKIAQIRKADGPPLASRYTVCALWAPECVLTIQEIHVRNQWQDLLNTVMRLRVA
jgi:hypothetical protein